MKYAIRAGILVGALMALAATVHEVHTATPDVPVPEENCKAYDKYGLAKLPAYQSENAQHVLALIDPDAIIFQCGGEP